MFDSDWQKRKDILDKLKTKSVTLLTSRTSFFGATIAERKLRYVVAIFLIGDGTASRTVNIEKLEEDGTTYTMKFNTVPVAPAQVQLLPPQGYDIMNPILMLEGGSDLKGIVSAGSGVPATIIYWDDVL